MGRFTDLARTATLVLPGGCQCPGTPHEADEWTYRVEASGTELRRARLGATDSAGRVDVALGEDILLAELSLSWNLLDDEGAGVPLTRGAIGRLDVETHNAMIEAIESATTAAVPLPNRSAVRSASGSRANGSPIRTRRR